MGDGGTFRTALSGVIETGNAGCRPGMRPAPRCPASTNEGMPAMHARQATLIALAASALLLGGGSRGGVLLSGIRANNVELAIKAGTLHVTMPRSAWQDPAREPLSDRDYMALVPIQFKDGTIELDAKGSLAAGAPDFARAFVGIAFRIADGKFEKIYLRPSNGIAQDQLRRNRAVQYAAYPDYRFDRLRHEAPGKYETSADIAPDRWVHMRIEVKGSSARLYLDRRANPVLIVNDLKLGADRRGAIGLWVETGTLAEFRNLKITPALAE
jgi:hypothetical protein